MSAIDLQPFPRWPLIAAGCLIALSIAGTGLVRLQRLGEPSPVARAEAQLATAKEKRTLAFVAREDGAIAVIEPETGAVIEVLTEANGGFVHGAMRGLRRTRMVHKAPLDPTLTIARWSDGRLTATDPLTGATIDLHAFGADNRRAFERYLTPAASAPVALAAVGSAAPSLQEPSQ
jgi:putative photosynthetic complex assembly protein